MQNDDLKKIKREEGLRGLKKDFFQIYDYLKCLKLENVSDLISTNQELLRLLGVHIKICDFLCSFFEDWGMMIEAGNKPTPVLLIHKEIANLCLEFLLFFILGNSKNQIEVTNHAFLHALEKNIHFSADAVFLLTQLCTGNSTATDAITLKTIQEIVTRLHPDSWVLNKSTVDGIRKKFAPLSDLAQEWIQKQ